MGKISIIIPCYNSLKYMQRCMDNLMKQSIGFENIEIVFVNNEPSIESDRFIAKMCTISNQIRCVDLDDITHVGNAWNAGLSAVHSDYLMMIDAADWMELNCLQRLYTFAQNNNCDIVHCGYTTEYTYRLMPVEESMNDKFIPVITEEQREKIITMQSIGITSWNNLYKTKYLIQNNIKFPEFLNYENIYFSFLNYCHANRIGVIEDILYHHCIRIENTNAPKNTDFMEDFYIVNELKHSYAKKNGYADVYSKAIEYDYILHYYIDGLKLLLSKYKLDPKPSMSFMRRHIVDRFPDYTNNKYFQLYNSNMLMLCMHLLSNKCTPEQLDQIIEHIRKGPDKEEENSTETTPE